MKSQESNKKDELIVQHDGSLRINSSTNGKILKTFTIKGHYL